MKRKVLLVDDESSVRLLLRSFLEEKGYEVAEAENSRVAEELVSRFHPDVALVDYALPDATALDLLRRLKELQPGIPVVILTGHASIELAVRAIKQGAQNFVAKPVHLASLALTLQKAIEEKENPLPTSSVSKGNLEIPDPFVGSSRLIRDLADQAHKVSQSQSPVLIQGATGTGKGVLARWLHANSSRAAEPFVDLNCAGLSRDFLETELFGHERGAFTGAVTAKSGLFEIADRGTIFLDEIGDVDPQVQPKLLKVLEERHFRRLGDVRDRSVDVRFIAATHEDLGLLAQEKRFRSDLYFRINTIRLIVPPLSRRPEDIPVLADRILTMLAFSMRLPQTSLAPAALKMLQEYTWPGNVRELRNVLERALVLGCGSVIGPGHLSFESDVNVVPRDVGSMTLNDLERVHIARVLQEEHGRVQVAAKRLGIGRSSLYKKLKDYDITLRS
ncbi:MAG TPA: sigma-54 dependent transcriptional regulator [Terriglobales bacterium]|nr:sigma-54 dependent transcriptional regulator [Terriglobales bacterium]